MDLKRVSFFDLHCDTAYECYIKNLNPEHNNLMVSLDKTDWFGAYKGCFAAWIRDDAEKPFELASAILDYFKDNLNREICLDSKSFIENDVLLSLEGGTATEGKRENLIALYEKGIRSLTLTWNGENCLASGVNAYGKLKSVGKSIIKCANELSMGVDLSHLNADCMDEALELSRYPFISHTAVYNVNSHKRNITVKTAKKVAQNGGVIGLCFYPAFLGEGDVFEAFYKNVFCLLDAGLEKSIAIGSDFDGAEMSEILSSVLDVPKLYEYLICKGIPKETVDDIFYNNAKRFYCNLLK